MLLTAAALGVHGYHPYAEDAEIYLPGIEKILDPRLFPSGQEFFASHAHLTFFPNVVAFSLRLTHLPLEAGLFIWQVLSIFLLLLACWQLSGLLFQNPSARWCGVCLVAGLLTIPVAGTALYIMDQYLNPRNLAAFAGVFAVTAMVRKKYLLAAFWLVFAAAVHPLMWVFPASWCALWLVLRTMENRGKTRLIAPGLAVLALLPAIPPGQIPPNPVLLDHVSLVQAAPSSYHAAAEAHSYFYIQRWEWYEWLGIAGPVLLLWWLGRLSRAREWTDAQRVAHAFAMYTLIYVAVALAFDLPPSFETLARLQPMRCLHLLYIVLFLFIGGFLGEYTLKGRVWLWLALFVPLGGGMFYAQRALFPASAHIEWPGVAPRNPWAEAFLWARSNTPQNAIFALDPQYMRIVGEDAIGFRCLAQRSRLADDVKDNGVVSMFPPLAEEWSRQIEALKGWDNFGAGDFARLKSGFGVTWVIVQQAAKVSLDCPHQNPAVRVCRIP